MYRVHQAAVSQWARRRPENFARVLQFCIMSQRRKFFNVPAAMAEAIAEGPETAGLLYGWRARAWAEIWDNRDAIFWHCQDIAAHGLRRRETADYMLAYLAGQFGLDVAKAGFACQLIYGVSGCLDSVNNGRLGLRRFAKGFSTLRTPAARRRRAAAYNGRVYRLGGPAVLWDDWCREMSRRYPSQFPRAYDASALHLECIGVEL